MEADYDNKLYNNEVRWDIELNNKIIAYFTIAKSDTGKVEQRLSILDADSFSLD